MRSASGCIAVSASGCATPPSAPTTGASQRWAVTGSTPDTSDPTVSIAVNAAARPGGYRVRSTAARSVAIARWAPRLVASFSRGPASAQHGAVHADRDRSVPRRAVLDPTDQVGRDRFELDHTERPEEPGRGDERRAVGARGRERVGPVRFDDPELGVDDAVRHAQAVDGVLPPWFAAHVDAAGTGDMQHPVERCLDPQGDEPDPCPADHEENHHADQPTQENSDQHTDDDRRDQAQDERRPNELGPGPFEVRRHGVHGTSDRLDRPNGATEAMTLNRPAPRTWRGIDR